MTTSPQLPLYGEVHSLGVDWLTITQRPREFETNLYDQMGPILINQHEIGNDMKPWNWMGYEGLQCGGAQCGIRADGAIAILKSGCASEFWTEVFPLASQCSRMDWQVTVRIGDQVDSYILEEYESAKAFRPERGRPCKVGLRAETFGSPTVYIGKRSSAQLGRIYNKGFQSKDPDYQGCARFETQLNKRAAAFAAAYLFNTPDRLGALSSGVSGFFRKRGVSSRFFHTHGEEHFAMIKERSSHFAADSRSQLRWLESQVQPTIKKLVARGMLQQVLDSLQLSTLVEVLVDDTTKGETDGSLPGCD